MSVTRAALLTLRELTATPAGATSGQDAQQHLQGIGPLGLHVHVRKTAEVAGTDLLTVRIQALLGTLWVDCYPLAISASVAVATAAGAVELTNYGGGSVAANLREQNIVEAFTISPFERTAFYDRVPSDILRVAWISSGAGSPSHTFEVLASYWS